MSAWDSFFMAEVGASAALAGLLFVGISINNAKILRTSALPDLALRGLALLFAILLVSSVLLLPGIGTPTLGVVLIVVGGGLSAVIDAIGIRGFRHLEAQYRPGQVFWVGLSGLATGLYPIAGALALLGVSGENYLLAAGFLTSFSIAITDSWVLLIEINR
jgi:hypothetical protein